jgi:hypothetical protein
MNRNRVLELALEELKRQMAGIDAEIESIQSELRIVGSAVRQTRSVPSAGAPRGKSKAASIRMKAIWAARRKAKAAKQAAKPKAPAAGAKIRPKTEAEKKALSLKMKQVWARKKAEAAKKAKGA